ncbi:MAG: M20/M25/M40 family metallo-hydrolase [Ruminococcaceae bacterium]|nr:M20/M25/M40 family metallo-hydrolase [Oscillospiraceae bacterium]
MKKIDLKPESERISVSAEQNARYIDSLSKMIACKTVYSLSGENNGEFKRFYSLIQELFPTLSQRAQRLEFGTGCFVYMIRGKRKEGKENRNIMLMSHHDVVDGGSGWQTDPFTPTVKDGYLYGRGTIDTKTPLFAELQACEELLNEGYEFDGTDLYIGSSDNEEVSGDGMVLATEYFRKNGIRFYTVLDEGGAITEGQIPGVACKSAVVAVHEKSRHLFKCRAVRDTKGHGGFGGASDNAVERLSRFISEVTDKKNKIYKGKFYPEVRATFEGHVPYMSFPMKLLFGNIGIFSPLIKKIMMGIPAAGAMLSTSLSFTVINGGDANTPGIRAEFAEALMMLRCVREDDLYSGLERIKAIGKKHGVTVEEVERDYCRPTDFCGEAFGCVERVLRKNFPDVAVVPFLLTAGTDARRFTDVADNILRFAPIDLSKKQFSTIHAPDEHIAVKNVGECVAFYKEFIKSI